MNITEIKKSALKNLEGRWESPVLLTLVYMAIMLGIGLMYWLLSFIPLVNIAAYAGVIAISTPITFGLTACFMQIKRKQDTECIDPFKIGFSSFKRAWFVYGNILKKMWVYIVIYVALVILFVIGTMGSAIATAILGYDEIFLVSSCIFSIVFYALIITWMVFAIMKGLYYSLSNYIAIDNTEITAKEAVEKSESLMQGNRGEFFLLVLSFIGWEILSLFTLGIGFLWLVPYMEISLVIYYENLVGKKESSIEEKIKLTKVREIEEKTSSEEKLKDASPVPSADDDNIKSDETAEDLPEVNENEVEKNSLLDDNGNTIN